MTALRLQATEVAYLRSRGKASIALLMLMMFILPIATPLSSADADAAARNAVDIRIGDMTLDGGGSAYNGSQLYVENATHTINVDVSNSGSISRDVIVYIYHKGSQLANEILVAEEGPFSIGSQQEITVLIQWTASPGNDQELIARTSIGSDEDRLPFNVRSAPQYNEGGFSLTIYLRLVPVIRRQLYQADNRLSTPRCLTQE